MTKRIVTRGAMLTASFTAFSTGRNDGLILVTMRCQRRAIISTSISSGIASPAFSYFLSSSASYWVSLYLNLWFSCYRICRVFWLVIPSGVFARFCPNSLSFPLIKLSLHSMCGGGEEEKEAVMLSCSKPCLC